MQFNQKFLKHVAMVDTPETLRAYAAVFGIILEGAEAEGIFKQIVNVRNECGCVELSDDGLEQIAGGVSKGKVTLTLEEKEVASGACSEPSGWLVFN